MDQYQYLLMCRIFTCKNKPNVRIHFTMYTVNMSMIRGWYARHAPFIRWTRIESPHSPNGEKGAGVYSSNGFPWTISIRATGHWGPPKCHETRNEAYFDLLWNLSFHWMKTCQKTKQQGFTQRSWSFQRCGMLFIYIFMQTQPFGSIYPSWN